MVTFAVVLRSVDVQYAMPMPGYPPPPPPMFPMPAPMPLMCPLPFAIGISDGSGNQDSTTTTTTTSKPDVAVAIPLPIPVPMPVPAMPAMPAMPPVPAMPSYPPPPYCQRPPPRPRSCPPCPPCTCKPACTPSFYAYCSPCHMKCRCKSVDDVPRPIPPKELPIGPPYAVQLPQIIQPSPVVLVPFPPMPPRVLPPRRRQKKKRPIYSSCSEESSETSSSSEIDYLRGKKNKRVKLLKRNPRSSEGENELVKPMLSYISENGDIKFETKISNNDVDELLGTENDNRAERRYQTVQLMTREDESHRPQLVVFSKEDRNEKSGRIKNKQVLLRNGISNHVLEDGRKQLIFRPPNDKKISNLSVSFQIV